MKMQRPLDYQSAPSEERAPRSATWAIVLRWTLGVLTAACLCLSYLVYDGFTHANAPHVVYAAERAMERVWATTVAVGILFLSSFAVGNRKV